MRFQRRQVQNGRCGGWNIPVGNVQKRASPQTNSDSVRTPRSDSIRWYEHSERNPPIATRFSLELSQDARTHESVLIPRWTSGRQSQSMLQMLLLQVTAAAVGRVQQQTDTTSALEPLNAVSMLDIRLCCRVASERRRRRRVSAGHSLAFQQVLIFTRPLSRSHSQMMPLKVLPLFRCGQVLSGPRGHSDWVVKVAWGSHGRPPAALEKHKRMNTWSGWHTRTRQHRIKKLLKCFLAPKLNSLCTACHSH